MPSCIKIIREYVLQYIVEPNIIIYYYGIDREDSLLECTERRDLATKFNEKDSALYYQKFIKANFNLEFQLSEVI